MCILTEMSSNIVTSESKTRKVSLPPKHDIEMLINASMLICCQNCPIMHFFLLQWQCCLQLRIVCSNVNKL